MSSLAATCADGYYHPHEDKTIVPSSSNNNQKYVSSAPRNKRLKKNDDSSIVVRFALIRNGRCLKCLEFLGAGSRFNAVKKQRCNNTSSSNNTLEQFSFTFSCPNCHAPLVVVTDPKRADFIYESGIDETASRKADVARIEQEEKNVELNPLMRLERIALEKQQEYGGTTTTTTTNTAQSIVENLDTSTSKNPSDLNIDRNNDFDMNRRMRRIIRERKAPERAGAKLGLGLPLLPKSKSDIQNSNLAIMKMKNNSTPQNLVVINNNTPKKSSAKNNSTNRDISLVVVKKLVRDDSNNPT
jgi:hypothetical protein